MQERLKVQTRHGQSIEDASMRMIDDEIGGAHNYNSMEWPIVRRVIHSTADFDFAGKNKIIFSNDAIQNGMNALKAGCSIVVDVNGVLGGFNKQNLRDFGNKTICKISDPDVMSAAKKQNTTRSKMSMRMSADEINDGVVVIGNAPTALQEVVQMTNEGGVQPALIIGIPVGFICAAESKDALARSRAQYITNIGRKGGSPSASAIINALFKLIRAKESSQ